MGILKEPAEYVKALQLPTGFSVCELGNQQMSGEVPRPAIDFYRKLGADRYVSIDGNGQGTITHDLNKPVTDLNLGTFDLVTDFGTGEHIFDQAQVWRTLHDLARVGGHIAFDRPSDGYAKHAFYLITAGLIQDLARANGYRILRLARKETPRGWLVRGILRKSSQASAFRVPQQGRYLADLQIPRGKS